MTTLILFTIGAAFVQRTTGFGFGIFIMTILPFILPSYGEATTLSGLLASVTSLIITVKYRRVIEWRKLLPILTVFLLASFLAIQVLSWMKGDMLKYFLGITLIISAVYFRLFADRIKVRPTLWMQAILATPFIGDVYAKHIPDDITPVVEGTFGDIHTSANVIAKP